MCPVTVKLSTCQMNEKDTHKSIETDDNKINLSCLINKQLFKHNNILRLHQFSSYSPGPESKRLRWSGEI